MTGPDDGPSCGADRRHDITMPVAATTAPPRARHCLGMKSCWFSGVTSLNGTHWTCSIFSPLASW